MIVHEYGHAVHAVPGARLRQPASTPASIGESFGDYLAVTVGLGGRRAVRLAGRGRAGLPDGLGRDVLHRRARTASAASTPA